MGSGRVSVAGRTFKVAVVLAFMSAPSLARAQDDDTQRAAARGLATEGLKAYEDGRWAEGIDRFQRAEALVHAPPHLLYIARASAKLGKLVQANEAYMKIVREELPAGAPRAFVEARKDALEEQAELVQRLARLTIVVKGEGASDATVTLDGVPVPNALVGVAQPADPGAHVLRASAAGWASRELKFELAEGANDTAAVELDQRMEQARADASEQEPGRAAASKRSASPLAWVALGVGAVGLGAGTFFMFQNRGKRSDADALCGDALCPSARRSEIEALDKEADAAATLSWVGYGVGAAGVLAGAALFVMRSSAPSKTGSATIHPWVGAGSAGVVGRF